MSVTRQIRTAASVVLAGIVVGGCLGRMERPGTGATQPDPRATGQSEFGSTGTAGSSSPPPGIPPGPPTVATERPAQIESGETAVVVGSTLYALGFGGLQVVEVAGEAGPRGRVAIPGVPRALFVAAGTAFAVMGTHVRIPDCPACPAEVQAASGSFVVAVDVADPRSPRLRATRALRGDAIRAALDGSGLHVVLRHGDGANPALTGRAGASLVSFDVTNPTELPERGRIDIPAPTWIEEVQFAPGVAYLGLYGRQFWAQTRCQPLGADPPPDGADGCTRLLAVDLATMQAGASLELRGRIFPGASDHQAGVLRALVVSSGAATPSNARFVTVTTRAATEMRALGTLELPGLASGDHTVRFAGDRAYLAAHDSDNPLLIVDFGQPARPALGGRLPAVGLIGNIVSASAERLVTAGVERLAPPCAKGEVAIFDVSKLASPTLLARQTVGSRRSGSGMAAGDDLLVLPFAIPYPPGPATEPYAPAGVQLIDLDLAQGSLRARGQVRVGADVERTVRVGDRLLALSSQRAEVLDVRDRDNPALVGGAQLWRTVSNLQPAGGAVVALVADWTFRPGYGPDDRFHLYLASPPDAPDARPALSLDGRAGPLFSNDRFVYQFRKARAADDLDPRLEVLEVVGSELRRRGSLSLAGPAEAGLDAVHEDERLARQVRQVAGTTFLVPLWRVRDCRPPIAATPAPAPPGCGFAGDAPPSPPPLPLPLQSPPPLPAPTAMAPPPAPGSCPGSDADFLVVDASKPDQPRIASRFRLEGDGEIQVALERDRTVLITQRERTRRPDGSELIRSFVTEVGLQDLDRPRVLPRVNLPGALVAERRADGTWFAVEPMPAERGQPGGVVLSALYHPPSSPRAFLQRQLALPGEVSGPVTAGDHLIFTVDGQLVTIDLRGPTAPAFVSRTPVPGATTSSDPWEPPDIWRVPSTDPPAVPPIYADVHRVVARHLFVTLGGQTMLIYEVSDPAHPRLLDRVLVSPSSRSPIRQVSANRVMIPTHEWGIEVVDLNLGTSLPARQNGL
jgi:hypothetical protein